MAVPLTILTGFLGAGKSSLLKYILSVEHGIKVAVIMNEFGDDVAELERQSVFEGNGGKDGGFWLTLPNGCLCCAGVDRGLKAIEELLMSHHESIEWVILEASGQADPCALIKRLWADPGMQSYLDGVVCVVDSSRPHLYDQQSEGCRQEAVKQAAVADVLVINKIDLVPASQNLVAASQGLEEQLSLMNPGAKRVKTAFSSVPLSHLFNLHAYSDSLSEADLLHAVQVSADPHPKPIRPLHLHLPKAILVDFGALEDWIFGLLWESRVPGSSCPVTGKIFRIKGRSFDGRVHRHVQAVEQVYDAHVITSNNTQGTFLLITGAFSAGEAECIKDSFYKTFAN